MIDNAGLGFILPLLQLEKVKDNFDKFGLDIEDREAFTSCVRQTIFKSHAIMEPDGSHYLLIDKVGEEFLSSYKEVASELDFSKFIRWKNDICLCHLDNPMETLIYKVLNYTARYGEYEGDRSEFDKNYRYREWRDFAVNLNDEIEENPITDVEARCLLKAGIYLSNEEDDSLSSLIHICVSANFRKKARSEPILRPTLDFAFHNFFEEWAQKRDYAMKPLLREIGVTSLSYSDVLKEVEKWT